MAMYLEITQNIAIEVEPQYLQEESTPEASQFVFAYHITITNNSEQEVQLLRRHWIITDGHGIEHEVEGEGVVGKQPKLLPGQKHQYSSFCPLPTPTGNMRGSFQLVDQDGKTFKAKIPLFFLRDAQLLH